MTGESGKPIGVIAVVVETSGAVLAERELRRSEAELRASEERLQLALSAGNSIGTWDWDVVADWVVADARFSSSTGLLVEAWLLRCFFCIASGRRVQIWRS